MTVKEFTKEVYEKYPKVWKRLSNKYSEEDEGDGEILFLFVNNEIEIYFSHYAPSYSPENEIESSRETPFYMLYGMFKEFFKRYNMNLFLMDFEVILNLCDTLEYNLKD